MDPNVQSLANVQDLSATQTLFSSLLWPIVQKYGSTFEEVTQYDGYDLYDAFLTAEKGSAIAAADLQGIQLLRQAKALWFPSTTLSGLLNISGFTNLQYLCFPSIRDPRR